MPPLRNCISMFDSEKKYSPHFLPCEPCVIKLDLWKIQHLDENTAIQSSQLAHCQEIPDGYNELCLTLLSRTYLEVLLGHPEH